MDAVTALVEHVCEQLQLLSASFERCLLVVEGSPAFLAQTWARAEVLYVAAERADILLKLLTSSGPAKTEACPVVPCRHSSRRLFASIPACALHGMCLQPCTHKRWVAHQVLHGLQEKVEQLVTHNVT